MKQSYKDLIIAIFISLYLYSTYVGCNDRNEKVTYKLQYELIADSLNRLDSIYQNKLDGLQTKIDSINKVDSVLIDSLIKTKTKDNEIYRKIMGANADSSYRIIIESLHSDSTSR